MTCTISLGPNDDLELRTPSGRAISIPVGPHSTEALWRILWNATQERREINGRTYASEFPSQHIIDLWMKEVAPVKDAEREAEEREEREAKAKERLAAMEKRLGITVKELDFDI